MYDWAPGELVRTVRSRFQGLPTFRRVAAIDVVLDLHDKLAAAGFIASDFYDGCLIYDFAAHAIHVVDLDNYRNGPFINHMGRMFGSTRFMAKEEFLLGARIDERTTVFAMGRMVEQFLSRDDAGSGALLEVASRACQPEPQLRFPTMAQFYRAWSAAREQA